MSELDWVGFESLRQRYGWWLEAYCVTYVRGSVPVAVLDRLDAVDISRGETIATIGERSVDAWERFDGAEQVVAATMADDWVVLIEINGFTGTIDRLMAPLSRGTTVMSHYRNVNLANRFSWWDDGGLRVSFEPLAPHVRSGSTPDALDDDLARFGFDPHNPAPHRRGDVFGLAENLTGIRVDANFLDNAIFDCGVVEVTIPGPSHLSVKDAPTLPPPPSRRPGLLTLDTEAQIDKPTP